MNKVFDVFEMEINKTSLVGRKLYTLIAKKWIKDSYAEPFLLVYWSYNRNMSDSQYRVEHSRVANAIYIENGQFYPSAKETWHTWEEGPL